VFAPAKRYFHAALIAMDCCHHKIEEELNKRKGEQDENKPGDRPNDITVPCVATFYI